MMRALFALSVMMLISSCSPIYQTTHEIVPPASEMGRMCANNCLLMLQNCQQNCAVQDQNCQLGAQLQAQNEYQRYVIDRQMQGRLIKKSSDDFYHPYSCSSGGCEANCQNIYHLCHTNCGGQVIPHTACVANCDEQREMP
jgi:hypothetical protein